MPQKSFIILILHCGSSDPGSKLIPLEVNADQIFVFLVPDIPMFLGPFSYFILNIFLSKSSLCQRSKNIYSAYTVSLCWAADTFSQKKACKQVSAYRDFR